MQFGAFPGQMSGGPGELYSSYSAVETRREWEIGLIKEKLARNEDVDLPVCRVERVGATATLRFGLKRGKLLYLFRYPHHDVEREKHRNVITRARYIKASLEAAGYTLIPWDFKKGKPPTFWEETAMDEEDDDLYGPSESPAPPEQKKDEAKNESEEDDGDEPMDEGEESGESESDDEDESDSDVEIIIEKPQIAPKPNVPKEPPVSKAIKIEAPPQPTSTLSQPSKSTAPSAPTQPGTAYPAVRTSTIDVDADPIYPPVGKPITQLDIDADLAESSKPWRLPGADQSDYFNYGFDEFSWEMYRQKQTTMTAELSNQKQEMSQLQQMFGMGAGGPGAAMGGAPAPPSGPSGAPTGPANGGGMPGGGMPVPPGGMDEAQMQMFFQQMAAQGGDMSQMQNMDFGQFMQMAQGGMGGGGGGGFGGQQGGGNGYGQGNQGGGGNVNNRGGGRRGRGNW